MSETGYNDVCTVKYAYERPTSVVFFGLYNTEFFTLKKYRVGRCNQTFANCFVVVFVLHCESIVHVLVFWFTLLVFKKNLGGVSYSKELHK